jgi:glycosyltransferase involved in cell wall biosynthesis
VLNHQASELFRQWERLDAVVVHAFQLFCYLTLYRRVRRGPLLALFQDYAPFREVTMLRNYGHDVTNDLRRKLRFQLETRFTRRADLWFPWSDWAKQMLIDDSGVPADRIHVVNVGVDLELWPYVPPPDRDGRPLRLLFVGGDLARKGGDLLLDVLRELPSGVAELDLVTRQPPEALPPSVRVHTGLGPNDPALRELYRRCDVFVLPTRADMSSIVAIEAMATGRPVVSTLVGGIPDIVEHGRTGLLVHPDDRRALRDAVLTLAADPDTRERMGRAGRERVERELNAQVSAHHMLSILKRAVAQRRARGGRSVSGSGPVAR